MDPQKLPQNTSFPSLVPFVMHPRLRGCSIPVQPFMPEERMSEPVPLQFGGQPQAKVKVGVTGPPPPQDPPRKKKPVHTQKKKYNLTDTRQ
jgi:hypothetical protein